MGEKQLAQIPCAEVLRDLRQLCAEGALVGLCQRSTVHRAVREQLRQALSHLCVGVKRRGGRGSCHGRAELLHRIAHAPRPPVDTIVDTTSREAASSGGEYKINSGYFREHLLRTEG